MTDNEKIAKWAGIEYKEMCTADGCVQLCVLDDPEYADTDCDDALTKGKPGCGSWKATFLEEVPDYPNDLAVYGLLDVLVSKGYSVIISCASNDGWMVDVHGINNFWVQSGFQHTKEQAIVCAVLAVIEKEAQGEM